VVHGDQRRGSGRLGERTIEPGERVGAELAAVLARDRRVERDEAQRPEVGGVVDALVAGAGELEVAAQRRAGVVVAGQDVQRQPERLEQGPDLLVLVVGGVLGQVAGDEHGRRARLERGDRLDGGGQPCDRVAAVPLGADVRVAELREQEHDIVNSLSAPGPRV
jgi:hypothetical protein